MLRYDNNKHRFAFFSHAKRIRMKPHVFRKTVYASGHVQTTVIMCESLHYLVKYIIQPYFYINIEVFVKKIVFSLTVTNWLSSYALKVHKSAQKIIPQSLSWINPRYNVLQ